MLDQELLQQSWQGFRTSTGIWLGLLQILVIVVSMILILRRKRRKIAILVAGFGGAFLLVTALAAFCLRFYAFLTRTPSIVSGVAKSHSLLLVGIFTTTGGMFLYWLTLHFAIRRTSVRVFNRSLEQMLDMFAGHRRFKIVKEFKEYCRSCEQMIERAVKERRGQGEREMFTIQTPAKSAGLTDQEKQAYQRYIATTNRVLLTHGWNYSRLVYLPPSPEVSGEALARSYEFVRTLLYEYFLGFEQGSAEPNEIKNIVPPLSRFYPYGATRSAPHGLDEIKNLAGVKVGYTARMEGLLDVFSRLDLHLPPSSEFSLAFSRELGSDPEEGAGNPSERDNKDFVGCIRVSEYEPRTPNRDPALGQVEEGVRARLAEVFTNEWRGIMDRNAVVFCVHLIHQFQSEQRDKTLVPFFDGWKKEEIANRWRDLKCDEEIFARLSTAATAAITEQYGTELSLKEFHEKALAHVKTELGFSLCVEVADDGMLQLL